MSCVRQTNVSVLTALLVVIAALFVSGDTVSAHEGEDHGGEGGVAAVSTSTDMQVRTARAGDLEVTLKHALIEPDKGGTARAFVTRFDSNEPVASAAITLLFTGGGTPVEATAVAGNTAGMYEAKLPPLVRGDYRLTARVEVAGATRTVEYGVIKVAASPATIESSSSWTRAVLIAVGLLVGLSIAGAVLFRAAQAFRQHQARKRNDGQAATA
ncbi:MAG: hypothetical protein MSG64_18375 [Pyrinomonadaceae bacterium MAG19_C2-C3]|nr:hypothetical protein [Pyrinomonadaceae bacterium MAG19_C2-C3]